MYLLLRDNNAMVMRNQNKQMIAVTLNLKHVQARTVAMRSRIEDIHSVSIFSVYTTLNVVSDSSDTYPLNFPSETRIEGI